MPDGDPLEFDPTDHPDPDWRRVGVASRSDSISYVAWQSDAMGYQLTRDDEAPSRGSGGYGNLEALMRLKGCRTFEVDEPAPALVPGPGGP